MAKAQFIFLQGPCVLQFKACLAVLLLPLLLPLPSLWLWKIPLGPPEVAALTDQEHQFLDMRPLMTTPTLAASLRGPVA